MSADQAPRTWVPEHPDGTWAEDDLDGPTPKTPRSDRKAFTRTALALLALAAGALAGALISPPAPPRPPPSITMTVQDGYVTDHPVLVVRLSIGNAGNKTARLTGLVVEGAGDRIVAPLDVTVAPHRSAVEDVELHPKCPGPENATRRTTVHAIAPSENGGTLPVTPTRALAAINGLCTALDTRLPTGWTQPRAAVGTHLEGGDLVVTVNDLSADGLAGILVDDQLLPTVLVGDQLLTSTTAKLTPGANTVLRLKAPAPCIQSSAPTTMRLLAHGKDSVEQRLVVVGPELTRWVRLTCAKTENR